MVEVLQVDRLHDVKVFHTGDLGVYKEGTRDIERLGDVLRKLNDKEEMPDSVYVIIALKKYLMNEIGVEG